MKETYAAQRLTVYISERDRWHGGPLYAALVARLHEAGLAGVTVLHGIEGYGAHGKVHTERIEVLFTGPPIVVDVVDTPQRIAAALPILDEMLHDGLVTLCDVQAVRYRKDSLR